MILFQSVTSRVRPTPTPTPKITSRVQLKASEQTSRRSGRAASHPGDQAATSHDGQAEAGGGLRPADSAPRPGARAAPELMDLEADAHLGLDWERSDPIRFGEAARAGTLPPGSVALAS